MIDSRLRKHPFGYWEIENKPTLGELQKYYANKYYQEGKGSYELEYSDEELMYFNAKLEQRWTVLQRYLSAMDGPPCMLDVGCGEGFALKFFKSKGWSVQGLDFSSAGVASKNPSCLDALLTGDIFVLLKAEIEAGETYDVVWLQNVLEHVLDPLDLLSSLRRLLTPGGVAVITVPNDCSITQRAALSSKHIDNPFWVAPPDHLTYFDGDSLANTANQTGWQCLEMLGDFPVEWFLFHPASNYVRDWSVGKDAHKARVQIENLIHAQPIDDVIRFWSAAAKLGLGRDITAFLRPSVSI
jgi:2-polyprenyl-3-methyl-5-hydroxy-6-metoxy-1,4-benzoquinol methylase